METLFLTSLHETSGRTAIIEESEGCIWLYVTAPNSNEPEWDCWLANTIPFESMPELDYFRGWQLPPPAIEEFAGPGAVIEDPASSSWKLRWCADGSAATALRDDRPIGKIVVDPPTSLSIHIVKSGPWGEPWDGKLV